MTTLDRKFATVLEAYNFVKQDDHWNNPKFPNLEVQEYFDNRTRQVVPLCSDEKTDPELSAGSLMTSIGDLQAWMKHHINNFMRYKPIA